MQDIVDEVATNKMRKRVTFYAIEPITKLNHPVHMYANLMSA